jgi:DNA-binding response OmpR family regulator
MHPARELILCVDNDADTCSMLRTLLGLSGYRVRTASSVAEALSFAQSERFALYLLDTRLADGSGLELCRKLRALDRGTPILFVSADACAVDQQRAIEAGAQAYLVKPVDPEVLQQVVGRLVQRAAGAAEGSSKSNHPL